MSVVSSSTSEKILGQRFDFSPHPETQDELLCCRSSSSHRRGLVYNLVIQMGPSGAPFLVVAVPLVLFLVRRTEAARTGSMRPAPSHDFPVMDLIEPPGAIYDPRVEDLNYRTLRDKLGSAFDPEFMSVQRPLDSLLMPNGTTEYSFKKTRRGRLVPVGRMPPEIRRLRLRNFGLRVGIGKRMRRKFKQMLWAYTYCPVVYRWKDIGVRFWPRWLRVGSCLSEGSCSFPKGMTCKASRHTSKTLLRWHCQNWDQKKMCQWLTVSYPITTECKCGC